MHKGHYDPFTIWDNVIFFAEPYEGNLKKYMKVSK